MEKSDSSNHRIYDTEEITGAMGGKDGSARFTRQAEKAFFISSSLKF